MSRLIKNTDITHECTAYDADGELLDLRNKDKIEIIIVDPGRTQILAGPFTVDPDHIGNDLENGVAVVDIAKEDTEDIGFREVMVDMQITEGDKVTPVLAMETIPVVNWLFP
jgi:hypothetical protein